MRSPEGTGGASPASEEQVGIVHRLLDEQIVDVEGRRCGRVDDLELRGNPPRVTAILVGDGLYPRRLPGLFATLARRWLGPERWGDNAVRVPWEDVDEIGVTVKLRGKAEEHGLGMGDDADRWLVRRLPWN
jgi:sporulation protein YlmC with PRC-barrel domain